MTCSVLCAPVPRKSWMGTARVLPDPIACSPDHGRPRRRNAASYRHKLQRNTPAMQTLDSERDPNAELHSFEPLRVVLALGALMLGLLLSLP